MVVKMAKWSPWPPASVPPATRKFQVKLTWFRLEGIENIFERKTHANGLALKVKWKGEPRKFGLHHLVSSKQRCREDLSRVKMLGEGQDGVTWDDDEFENTCCLTALMRAEKALVVTPGVVCKVKLGAKIQRINRMGTRGSRQSLANTSRFKGVESSGVHGIRGSHKPNIRGHKRTITISLSMNFVT
nr:structural maintenance of chromosomes flexible hinge domain protein [Ipomoea batatas]